jgi:hypothetical protein
MEPRAEGPLFHEEQRFDRSLWVVPLAIGVPFLVMIALGIWQQIVKGIPFGNQPMSDGGLIAFALGTAATIVLIAWLLASARLVTEVTVDALSIRFHPFHRKPLVIRGIATAAARRYRPIAEYGGWGIRYGWKGGRAYNVSGDEGVQLVLANGRRILIGSQRARELEMAIRPLLAEARLASVASGG